MHTQPSGSREARAGGEGQTRRQLLRRLFHALVDNAPDAEESAAGLARALGLPLPGTVRAVALTPAAPAGTASAAPAAVAAAVSRRPLRLPKDVPCAFRGDVTIYLLLPDAGHDLHLLLPWPGGHRIAVGPVVRRRDAGRSLASACRLLELTAQTVPEGVLHVNDHLPELALLQDDFVLRRLVARWLRPLDRLTGRQQRRLAETLLAWLEGGTVPRAARTLGVHPQTVHYRMRQLEKLFGSSLHDSRARFEILLALKACQLLHTAAPSRLSALADDESGS